MTQLTAVPITCAQQLDQRICNKTARVGIIGLGYVGLPLAVEFAKAGFHVTGIDVSKERVGRLLSGESHVLDVPSQILKPLVDEKRITATTDFSVVRELDTVNICVPTPLRKTKDPDMSYVDAACRNLAAFLHPGMLIVLESTTYPGTTTDFMLPILQCTGLKVGQDFFLCFSPERVDPGNGVYHTANIPKVVGGVTPACTRLATMLYSHVMTRVVPVSSPNVAEMVKLLENTFRMINIGLVNEMAVMCDRMNIDVWEVIDAAATKPFGFMPFYPGPGLGGHCIPIDPFYLSWKSREAGFEARFIELAGQVNGVMPRFVVEKIQNALNGAGKPVRGAKIQILGVAYKADIDDVRESPALDIIHMLRAKGAEIGYSDPHVPRLELDEISLRAEEPYAACLKADCTVIITNHRAFDYAAILERSHIVVDTRNALKAFKSAKIIRL